MWWHTVTHGRRSERETREWSGSSVRVTWLQNTDLHKQYKPCRLMRTPRLPVVDWTDAPADLNRLVRFAERRNLVSARVPSHFKRSVPLMRTPRLPVVDRTDASAHLNGLIRFAERRNLLSARVPSHFKHSLPSDSSVFYSWIRSYFAVEFSVTLITNCGLWRLTALLNVMSRPGLQPTQPPIQCVLENIFLG
jgi:hypothetical protein